jgi:PelA/Pel-15E family pectate lyase
MFGVLSEALHNGNTMSRHTPSIAPRVFALVVLLCSMAYAISPVSKYLDKPGDWYGSPEAAQTAAIILSWQAVEGGWPKNVDTVSAPFTGDPSTLHSTFDNGATTYELRYLAKMFNATKDEKYRAAFLKGLDLILKAQYPNGGWPQYYPLGKDYSTHITFNDGAMERLMLLTRDVSREPEFAFVDAERRAHCKKEFDRGIDCILKCQVKVNGKLTVWCAQHDEHDFSPAKARTFELVSLSGAESVGLVELLMSLEHPSPRVIDAVNSAVAWFERSKIPGIRVEDGKQAGTPRGFERFVVEDPTAPPMWARFYDIPTNQPIFVDRDSIPKSKITDIGIERRTGYKWLGYWPKDLLEKDYPRWKAKLAGESKS